MYKTWLICKREYLSRVKKKSFLVMTLLSPLLMVLFYGIIIYFSINKELAEDSKTILVSDETGIFENNLETSNSISFQYQHLPENSARNSLSADKIYGVLLIKKNKEEFTCQLLTNEQPGLITISNLEGKLESVLKNHTLRLKGIDPKILEEINSSHIKIETKKNTDEGIETGNSGVTTILGFGAAFLIYFFIFLYGVQVMKGVIEEKTNRIVEVIISSVKPFQLMMGKILGIALVGFTQFIIWVGLVALLSGPASALVMNLVHVDPATIADGSQAIPKTNGSINSTIFEALGNINFALILGMFIFYFIGGYLFYGALFAAVGSAVDNETDTQQFMMPITLPLIFSFALAQSIMNSPNSALSIWLSMIPFSSPIIMMIRIPFGVPVIEIIASMVCMILGFLFTVWFASRIYRIGILTYGKKPSYKEILKWLFRKN